MRGKIERAPLLMSLADQQQITNAGFADIAAASTTWGVRIATELDAKFTLAVGAIDMEVAMQLTSGLRYRLCRTWVIGYMPSGKAGDKSPSRR